MKNKIFEKNSLLNCFLFNLKAFANLTLHVRRELCKVLVYAQVDKAQTVVMNDGERYDSWSVIINGVVADETIEGELIRTLMVGDSFGCGPTLDPYCHVGIMKTRVDDCQFVVVAQNDYYAILNQVKIRFLFFSWTVIFVFRAKKIFEKLNRMVELF